MLGKDKVEEMGVDAMTSSSDNLSSDSEEPKMYSTSTKDTQDKSAINKRHLKMSGAISIIKEGLSGLPIIGSTPIIFTLPCIYT